MSVSVYRLYAADGSLVYVGCSSNPGVRIRRHRREQPWGSEVAYSTVTVYPSQFEARQAERRAIFDEQPRFNVRHKTTLLTYRVAAVLAQSEMSDEDEQRALNSIFVRSAS